MKHMNLFKLAKQYKVFITVNHDRYVPVGFVTSAGGYRIIRDSWHSLKSNFNAESLLGPLFNILGGDSWSLLRRLSWPCRFLIHED
jgi:hypothetical protein